MRRVTPVDTDNLSNLFDDPEEVDIDEDFEDDMEDDSLFREFFDDPEEDFEDDMEDDSLFREFDELPEAI